MVKLFSLFLLINDDQSHWHQNSKAAKGLQRRWDIEQVEEEENCSKAQGEIPTKSCCRCSEKEIKKICHIPHIYFFLVDDAVEEKGEKKEAKSIHGGLVFDIGKAQVPPVHRR